MVVVVCHRVVRYFACRDLYRMGSAGTGCSNCRRGGCGSSLMSSFSWLPTAHVSESIPYRGRHRLSSTRIDRGFHCLSALLRAMGRGSRPGNIASLTQSVVGVTLRQCMVTAGEAGIRGISCVDATITRVALPRVTCSRHDIFRSSIFMERVPFGRSFLLGSSGGRLGFGQRHD